MTADLSFWHLVVSADAVVKLVLLLLLFASIWSWAMIFSRRANLRKARKQLDAFEKSFWSGSDLNKLYQGLDNGKKAVSGNAAVFAAGFKTFLRLRNNSGMGKSEIINAIQRSMRVCFMREADKLEQGFPMLATIGSVSPYIGLFGTVWGIMNSFTALGSVQQATLSMVAPGISEALIATAMGLFVAIPAVVAYNRFSAKSDGLVAEYENFQDEFLGILQRELHHES